MSSWECQSCGYRYEPAKGDEAAGVPPGTPFEKLPRAWRCPKCRAGRDEFEEADPDLDDEEVDEDEDFDDEEGLDEEDDAAFSPDEDEDEEIDEDDAEDFAEDEADADEMEEDEVEEDDESGLEDEEDEDEEDEDEEDEDFEDDEGLNDDEADEAGDDASDDEPEEGSEESEDDLEEDLDDEALADTEEDEDYEDDTDLDEDPLEDDEEEPFDEDTRYICTECGWVYDPAHGHPGTGVAPGTPFDDLLDDWTCPQCGAGQARFAPHEDAPERPFVAPAEEVEKELEASSIEQMAETGRPSGELGLPRRLSPGLGDLLFRPVPLFNAQIEDTVAALTLIGRRAERPMHLTTPIIVAPMPFGVLTNALKNTIARATARVGTACTSGGPMLGEARRAAAVYILEVAPGRPAPSPEDLLAADAAEIILGRGWTYLEEELSPGRFSGGMLAPISSSQELKELVQAVRKSLRGPVGIRLPAGAIEADLDNVMKAHPDYLVLEGYGAGSSAVPGHVREHANLPAWLAVHRARQFLDDRGYEGVGLVAAGDMRSPADFAKLLALGADAVLVSTAAVVAMGAWDLRPVEGVPRELADMRFDPAQAVERLANYLRAATEELMDFCRLVGKSDVHDLDRSDLLTGSEELARILGLGRPG
jgi:rubredoxin